MIQNKQGKVKGFKLEKHFKVNGSKGLEWTKLLTVNCA